RFWTAVTSRMGYPLRQTVSLGVRPVDFCATARGVISPPIVIVSAKRERTPSSPWGSECLVMPRKSSTGGCVTETTRKGNSDDDHLAQNRQYHVSCLGSRARRGVLYPDAGSAQNVGGSGTAHDGLHLCRE